MRQRAEARWNWYKSEQGYARVFLADLFRVFAQPRRLRLGKPDIASVLSRPFRGVLFPWWMQEARERA
jgi:hypothetical protein